MKVVKAILGGAVGAALLTTVALTVFNFSMGGIAETHFLISMVMWFVSTALLAAGFASTLGLAWHALASGRGWRSVHHYWLPGALTGALPMLLIFPGTLISIYLGIYAAALGGLTGLFAWLIRRPDRDVIANPPTSPP